MIHIWESAVMWPCTSWVRSCDHVLREWVLSSDTDKLMLGVWRSPRWVHNQLIKTLYGSLTSQISWWVCWSVIGSLTDVRLSVIQTPVCYLSGLPANIFCVKKNNYVMTRSFVLKWIWAVLWDRPDILGYLVRQTRHFGLTLESEETFLANILRYQIGWYLGKLHNLIHEGKMADTMHEPCLHLTCLFKSSAIWFLLGGN